MSRVRRLGIVLVLNLVLISALVVVGLSAHSLGVLAEGADYAADAGAIVVSLLAIRLSSLPPTAKRPKGYPRATVWAAAVNAGWMLVLCVLIVVGGLGRLVAGAQVVHGLPVLIVSGIAAVLMFAGALVLGGDADGDGDRPGGDLNMRAVLLDTAGDAAAAGGVAAAGGIIFAAGGLYWLDPAIALVIALVVGYHAVRLLLSVISALRAPPATPERG